MSAKKVRQPGFTHPLARIRGAEEEKEYAKGLRKREKVDAAARVGAELRVRVSHDVPEVVTTIGEEEEA